MGAHHATALFGTAMLLFDSRENQAVVEDPANKPWVDLLRHLDDERLYVHKRRYHLALNHFRSNRNREKLPQVLEIEATGRQEALRGILDYQEENKKRIAQGEGVFVDAAGQSSGDGEDSLPASLSDLSISPPSLQAILSGPGRPPIDGACMIRAFVAAPLLGVDGSVDSVHGLLHSNPQFAHLCGFEGRSSKTRPGELTSIHLPSLSVCENFDEVMTRYGLWHEMRVEQVRENFKTGTVEVENTMAFDTTHIEANSHCSNVSPEESKAPQDGASAKNKEKRRKVPNLRKTCDCGKEKWEICPHPWVPTDLGAAVVVKGPTRVYWAHKTSVVSFGDSEIPFDVRVLNYAATHDGKTLIPHLELLEKCMPDVVQKLEYVLADTAYAENREKVGGFGNNARLLTPVVGRAVSAKLAEQYRGIDRFTNTGLPICEAGHKFVYSCKDTTNQTHVFAAPVVNAVCVCKSCPNRVGCLEKGERRHIRVPRAKLPQIDWDSPQHLERNKRRYQQRTGVERAIKRLKVDLNAEALGHRDVLRVQAHMDKRLLALHVLLATDRQ